MTGNVKWFGRCRTGTARALATAAVQPPCGAAQMAMVAGAARGGRAAGRRLRAVSAHVAPPAASTSALGTAAATAPVGQYDWSAIEPPALPLPSLDETVERYIEHLRPLCSPVEVSAAAETAKQFAASAGAVQAQGQLEAAIVNDPSTSYVKPYWDRMYLGGRYPVPINSNPFVKWHAHPDPAQMGQATRASTLVHCALKWRQGQQTGTVEPDGPPDKRFCMSEYERLFCTSRIPVANGVDYHLTVPTSRHIIVLRGNAFHKLTVVSDDGDGSAIASQETLERALQQIIDDNGSTATSGAANPLAVLTAADRDHWGLARDAIVGSSESNASALHEIESAILHISLDITSPTDQTELFEVFLHGGAHSEPRWYDKSISLIV